MGEALSVVREALESFNSHDQDRIRSGYADNAVFDAPGDIRLTGPDAISDYAMAWLNAFPDARLTTEQELEAGDWVAFRFTFTGTHDAPLAGPDGEIPATHKQLKGRGAELFHVVNGKIAEEHLYYDQMQVLTQLGLVPETAATA